MLGAAGVPAPPNKADLAYEWQFQGITDHAGMSGAGTMTAAQVQASAQKALKGGRDLSRGSWITVKDGTVTALDFDR